MATTSSLSSSSALSGAGTLSSAGLGSGLDVNGIVTKLMDIERQPITNLDAKVVGTKAQITAYGQLKSSLATLQSAAKTLASADTFKTTKATVADSTLFSATTTTAAQPGSYSIDVRSLATAQKLLSTAFASTADNVGSGTLTFEFGTYSTGDPPVTFTNNPDKVTKSVTIPSDASSLADVAGAINAAKIGVSASIINDGSSYYLSLSPADSGAANALRITVDDADDGNNTDAAGLSRLAFDNTTGGIQQLTEKIAPADAELNIDGVTIRKPLNVIDDAIAGVTINLTKADPGVPTTMTVARDDAVVKAAVSGFVKAYNDASKIFADLLAYNVQTGETGALQGEGTVRNIQNQVRSALSQSLSVLPDQIGGMSELGVTFQRDGTLTFEDFKLQTTLRNPQKDIQGFFAGSDDAPGIMKRMGNLLDSMLGTGGMLSARISGLNDRVTSYETQKTALAKRMTAIENRYRKQFTSLDTLVASMNKTSAYLTQQLANLPSINGSANG